MHLAATAVTAAFLFAAPAVADVTHVVGRGHTIDSIAGRYHVSARAIIEANHLRDAKHLRVGDELRIPGVEPRGAKTAAKGGTAKGKGADAHGRSVSYVARAKTPGVVHATRLAFTEDYTIRISTRRGRQPPTAQKAFEKMMRSSGAAVHGIDPRLIALVGVVSNHFGSRRIQIVSGFRPYSPTQYTKHSNHNVGRAIDFRIEGVPNEVVRDFCRTLKNTGCGYYPNSTFVHMDARDKSTYWIDYSRPGEPPRYNAPDVNADEGTSDVAEEPHGAELGAPPSTPTAKEPAATATTQAPSTPLPASSAAPAPAASASP